MKSTQEEQMKDALNAASLKELLPDFDSEDTWAALAKQLPNHNKGGHIINLRWVAYAAAVLLVVLGSYALLQLTGPDNQPSVALQEQPVAAPAKPDEPGTRSSYLKPAPQTDAIADASKQVTQEVQPPTELHAAKTPENVQPTPETVTPAIISNNTPAPEAIAKAAPKKVTHYLDLEEDAHGPEVAETIAGPSFIRIQLNKPGIPQEDMHQKPLKELVFALGR